MGGLLERDWDFIRKSFEKFPEIDSVILFGSRALGNYKKGSDVDIALKGDTITHQTMMALNDWLNEIYPLPYVFDIVHYSTLTNDGLKNHIDTFGKEIYQKA